jgi:hypothetical protein
MGNSARFGLILLGVFGVGIACAVGLWYVSSGDTTSVLAAMVEQTPTPAVLPTLPPGEAERREIHSPGSGQVPLLRGRGVRRLPPRFGTFGTVLSVTGNEVSVRPQIPARDFTLDVDTKIIVAGKPDATTDDIQPGDKILVLGGLNRQRAPRAILAAPASYSYGNVALGRITSLNGEQIVLFTRSGELRVNLDESAQIFGNGLQALTAGDLHPGRALIVIGTRNEDGTMQGQVIFVPPTRQTN